MPQMGICYIAVVNNCIEYGCSSFVVPGNGPALLEMSDCEWLELVAVSCQAADNQYRK